MNKNTTINRTYKICKHKKLYKMGGENLNSFYNKIEIGLVTSFVTTQKQNSDAPSRSSQQPRN